MNGEEIGEAYIEVPRLDNQVLVFTYLKKVLVHEGT